jgi:hypothetical protein
LNLGDSAQHQLATWITKTVMAAEYVDRTKVAIPQGDRTLFMSNPAPLPTCWWIWIAGSQGARWLTGLHHFSARASVPPVDPKTQSIPNLQSTTIGIGCLLVFCVSSNWPHFSRFELSNPDRSNLIPIWPAASRVIEWPPNYFLRDDEIDVIAANIPRAFGRTRSLS